MLPRHFIRNVLLSFLTASFPMILKASSKEVSGSLHIAGGTAHLPVMADAAKIFMGRHPKATIHISGGGSGVGVQKVGHGLVAIGNTGRPLSEEEVKTFHLTSVAFALDGIAMVVHPQNPLTHISSAQIHQIFSGKITNWKDLGWKNHPITLYTRDEASGTRETFATKLLGKDQSQPASAHVVVSNGAMKNAIAHDLWAMGYISIGHINSQMKTLVLDGIAPTQDNTLKGIYPVARKLYMNYRNDKIDPLRDLFIDFILSNEGAKITEAHGYLPLTPLQRKG